MSNSQLIHTQHLFLSALILALTSFFLPCYPHSLFLVKKHIDTCTPLFLSQWNLSGVYMLLRLNLSNHSSQFQCIFASRSSSPYIAQREWCNSVRRVQAIYFCSGLLLFFVFFLLKSLQTKLRTDVFVSLTWLDGAFWGCTVTDVIDEKTNHCYYYRTVKDKYFDAPQLACWQLAAWSLSWTLSLMLWKTSSRKCFPHQCAFTGHPAPPFAPAKTPFQVTCNISHSTVHTPYNDFLQTESIL